MSRLCLLALCSAFAALPATAQDTTRYVSDEIPIVLRAAPGGGAEALGALAGGARLELLEARGGYAHVRTADGREGWVPERYLESEPAAHERLPAVLQQLEEARAELQKTRAERDQLLQDFTRIAESGGSTPAYARLEEEAQQLRARVQALEQQLAERAAAQQDGRLAEQRRMMLFGGGLVVAGVLLALLLARVWPKRRW